MRYKIIEPPQLLKPYVRHFWILEDDRKEAAETVYKTLVDDSSGFIFQHHNEESAFYHPNNQPLKKLFFYGQWTRPTTTYAKGAFDVVGVHFHPHAIKTLFGVDANVLTDQMEDMDLLKKGAIDKRLQFAASNEDRLDILVDWLSLKACYPNKQDHAVNECLQLINSRKGDIGINVLLSVTRVSERQLERRFKAYIGISPKLYTRIIRFREALRLMKEKKYQKLSDVAFDLNYADQPHFIRDIREFSGYTPSSLPEDVNELVVNVHIRSK